jgi:hypothetical protein
MKQPALPSVWLFISDEHSPQFVFIDTDEHTFGPVNGRASLPASKIGVGTAPEVVPPSCSVV